MNLNLYFDNYKFTAQYNSGGFPLHEIAKDSNAEDFSNHTFFNYDDKVLLSISSFRDIIAKPKPYYYNVILIDFISCSIVF